MAGDDDRLYRGLFAELDEHQPFYQAYFAFAPDPGTALERMRRAARGNQMQRPLWRELDAWEMDDPQDPGFEIGYSRDRMVFWDITRHYWEPDGTTFFHFPYGVIPCGVEGDVDTDDIAPGYEISHDDGLYELHVNVENDALAHDYRRFLEAFEPFRVFWYKLHDHWNEGDSDELFVNEQLTDAQLICRHLGDNEADSVRNGYVTLTAYASEGATNVNISDHRKIVVLTESKRAIETAEFVARGAGYRPLDPFVTIDRRVYHYHFRDPSGRDRVDLVTHLASQGFSPWDPGGTAKS